MAGLLLGLICIHVGGGGGAIGGNIDSQPYGSNKGMTKTRIGHYSWIEKSSKTMFFL